jgi:hypothetical protein
MSPGGRVPTELAVSEAAAVSDDQVTLTLPVAGYTHVARLVTGGIASRLRFGFEAVDDLQLAVELILLSLPVRAGVVELALGDDGERLRVTIGPVGHLSLADRHWPVDGVGIELGQSLRRLVDSVELTSGEGAVLVLTKALPAAVA